MSKRHHHSPKLRRTTGLRTLLVALSLGTFAFSCHLYLDAPRAPGIERKQPPIVGVDSYDRFFAQVVDLQSKLEVAQMEDQGSRAELASHLDLVSSADAEVILAKLRLRATTLRRMHLTISPEKTGQPSTAQLQVRDPGLAVDDRVEDLENALEETANRQLTVVGALGVVPTTTRLLRSDAQRLLRTLDDALAHKSEETRADIATELRAALVLLRRIGTQSQELRATSQVFVQDLREVINATDPQRESESRSRSKRGKPEPRTPDSVPPQPEPPTPTPPVPSNPIIPKPERLPTKKPPPPPAGDFLP